MVLSLYANVMFRLMDTLMCRLLFVCCSVDELVAYAVRVDFDCKVDLVVLPL